MECLVTKLKAEINDDSLPILGQLKCIVKGESANKFVHIAAKTAGTTKVTLKDNTINVVNTGATKLSSTSLLLGMANQEYPGFTVNGSNEFEMTIDNKYELSHFACVIEVDLSELKYLDLDYFATAALENYSGSRITGDISNFANHTNMEIFAVRMTGAEGDIGVIANMPKIRKAEFNYSPNIYGNISVLANKTNIESVVMVGTRATGNIASFGKLTKMTYCECTDCDLNGTIEELVALQRANGRTSGRFYMGMNLGKNVTFNGEPITTRNGKYLVWTPTTITLENY